MADPVPHLLLGFVVFIASLAFTAAPRLLADMSDEAIIRRVTEAPVTERNMTVGRDGTIVSGVPGNEFSAVEDVGRAFRENNLPDSLRGLIVTESYVADAPAFLVEPWPDQEDPGFSTFVKFRYQQDVADHITLVSGSLPAAREPVEVVFEDDEVVPLPVTELAVTAETLEALGVERGDQILVRPDVDDPRVAGIPPSELPMRVLEISGIIQPVDPDAEYWNRDISLDHPREVFTADFDPLFVFTTGLIDPSTYRQLLREMSHASWTYRWRYAIDPSLVTAEKAERLAEDLRSMETSYRPLSVALSLEFGFSTGLSDLIDAFLERRAATISMLSLISAGLLSVVLAIAALLAALAAHGRQTESALLRGRGASVAQLALTRGVEGALLAAPTAVLGFLTASYLVPLG
ncbi:MAG: hypothetical protein HKN74_14190 [Acidimicrobiia bacterium]|nr:hypothetical protein [Acidimicrobiia bacterium]